MNSMVAWMRPSRLLPLVLDRPVRCELRCVVCELLLCIFVVKSGDILAATACSCGMVDAEAVQHRRLHRVCARPSAAPPAGAHILLARHHPRHLQLPQLAADALDRHGPAHRTFPIPGDSTRGWIAWMRCAGWLGRPVAARAVHRGRLFARRLLGVWRGDLRSRLQPLNPGGVVGKIQASVDRLRVNRLGPAQGHGVWNAKGGAETQLLSGVVGTELSDPGRMASASASSRLWPACGRAS